MTVDPDSPDLLFEQVAEILRGQIASGELPPRRKLPTQEDLADQLKVSRGTVLRATRVFTDEGLIRFVPGRGLFTVDPDVMRRHAADTLQVTVPPARRSAAIGIPGKVARHRGVRLRHQANRLKSRADVLDVPRPAMGGVHDLQGRRASAPS
jgi:GntR family transcriptional regulator